MVVGNLQSNSSVVKMSKSRHKGDNTPYKNLKEQDRDEWGEKKAEKTREKRKQRKAKRDIWEGWGD